MLAAWLWAFVLALPLSAAAQGGEEPALRAWFAGYDAAFNAKDLQRLATFYHPDVTIFEGGGTNDGWVDYRDHHLGPELKAFENLLFTHRELNVSMLDQGRAAYATARYNLRAKMGERAIESDGLATYVLIRGADGGWKIRHSHTSSRPARRSEAAK